MLRLFGISGAGARRRAAGEPDGRPAARGRGAQQGRRVLVRPRAAAGRDEPARGGGAPHRRCPPRSSRRCRPRRRRTCATRSAPRRAPRWTSCKPRIAQRNALAQRVPDVAGAAQVRHRRHRQHLRRRGPGARGGPGGRGRHRRHPLHRAVAARLRAPRRDHRGLRRHLRHPGELPHHARGPGRREPASSSATSSSPTTRRGLCMAEIAFCAAYERLDMLLNDAMYGILFRDINMRRTFIDQYFSRRICALAGIIINTGEDNYITTADAYDAAHTVIASQFINECFAKRAGLQGLAARASATRTRSIPHRPDTLLLELSPGDAGAPLLPRRAAEVHAADEAQGDGHLLQPRLRRDGGPGGRSGRGRASSCSGMMTEAMHTPLLADRYVALKAAAYIHRAARGIDEEFTVREDGKIANRARFVFGKAMELLEECHKRRHGGRHRPRPLRRREARRDRRQGPRRRAGEGARTTSTRSWRCWRPNHDRCSLLVTGAARGSGRRLARERPGRRRSRCKRPRGVEAAPTEDGTAALRGPLRRGASFALDVGARADAAREARRCCLDKILDAIGGRGLRAAARSAASPAAQKQRRRGQPTRRRRQQGAAPSPTWAATARRPGRSSSTWTPRRRSASSRSREQVIQSVST